MTEFGFFAEYGLFLLKVVTIVIAIVAVIAVAAIGRAQGRVTRGSRWKNLNSRYNIAELGRCAAQGCVDER